MWGGVCLRRRPRPNFEAEAGTGNVRLPSLRAARASAAARDVFSSRGGRACFAVLVSVLFLPPLCSRQGGVAAIAAAAECPNEALRAGASAALPDCRAYELVTPPEAAGLFVGEANGGLPLNRFATERLTQSGSSFLYFTQGGSLEKPAGPGGVFDQYQAVRTPTGWSTVRRVSPSGEQSVLPNAGGVSADHGFSFYNVGPVFDSSSGGTLAVAGEANYLGMPDGSFELIGKGSLGTENLAEGRWISPGGEHVVFTTRGPRCSGACEGRQLEPNAPPTGTPTVYERSASGPTAVVSLLPHDVTPAAGEAADYQGASADGSAIAFKVDETLYVRVDGNTTEEVVGGESVFAGISADGTELFYMLNGNVFAFNVILETTVQITTSGDVALVNISADGSHLYFISPSLLDGAAGLEGEPNLYMWSAPTGFAFVATVSPADLSGIPALTNWTSRVVDPAQGFGVAGPGASSARVTPDGRVLAFESHAKLTEYENAGHTEIYRYDSESNSLVCASCNPAKEPAGFDARFEPVDVEAAGVDTEAAIFSLSSDGRRIFFETEEGLLVDDVDGVNDIYEWHVDSGEAKVSLISSGNTAEYPGIFGSRTTTNNIFGITPSGDDVVFGSWQQLVPAAGRDGVRGIYDARVGGGFPQPARALCAEAVCESPSTPPPSLSFPASDKYAGKGNVRPGRLCPRKKADEKGARGHRRCLRHHKQHHKRRPGHRRGAPMGSEPRAVLR
jgi:hypothetical protein